MLINNKKWRNYIILSLAFAVLVIVFEIFPRYGNIASLAYDFYTRGVETDEAEKNTETESSLAAENKSLKQRISGQISAYEDNQRISSIISFLDEAAY